MNKRDPAYYLIFSIGDIVLTESGHIGTIEALQMVSNMTTATTELRYLVYFEHSKESHTWRPEALTRAETAVKQALCS